MTFGDFSSTTSNRSTWLKLWLLTGYLQSKWLRFCQPQVYIELNAFTSVQYFRITVKLNPQLSLSCLTVSS